jgi:hypothetical protein
MDLILQEHDEKSMQRKPDFMSKKHLLRLLRTEQMASVLPVFARRKQGLAKCWIRPAVQPLTDVAKKA